MAEPTNTEIMEKLARMDEKFTIGIREANEHRDKILDTVEHNNQRISWLENWINEYRIRKEEREKYLLRSRESNADNINSIPLNIFNDPKVSKAVIALLTATTTLLLVIQATWGR